MNSEDERLREAREGVFKLARELTPIFHLWAALSSDVAAARAAMVSNDTQFARRQFVRTTFAKLEGLTSTLKQLCLRPPTTYSAAESALLREETFSLDDKGEPRVAASHLTEQRINTPPAVEPDTDR